MPKITICISYLGIPGNEKMENSNFNFGRVWDILVRKWNTFWVHWLGLCIAIHLEWMLSDEQISCAIAFGKASIFVMKLFKNECGKCTGNENNNDVQVTNTMCCNECFTIEHLLLTFNRINHNLFAVYVRHSQMFQIDQWKRNLYQSIWRAAFHIYESQSRNSV